MRSPPSPPVPQQTSILVVAEHALVRAGLRSVLVATPGFGVIAEAPDVHAAMALAEALEPDVILLDAPPVDGAMRSAVDVLRKRAPDACIVCLTRGDGQTCAGLQCVPPAAGIAEFCSTLGAVLGDRCAACVMRGVCPAPRLAVALSRREKQVAIAVAEGMSSKQIAAALGIGLRTVNTYRESLSRKLGGSSAAVLTRYVLEQNLAV